MRFVLSHFGNPRFKFFVDLKNFIDFDLDIYEKMKYYKCGIYHEGRDSLLYTADTDLLKSVMIRDFNHFIDQGFVPAEILHFPVI